MSETAKPVSPNSFVILHFSVSLLVAPVVRAIPATEDCRYTRRVEFVVLQVNRLSGQNTEHRLSDL